MTRLTKLIRISDIPQYGKCNNMGNGLSLMWSSFMERESSWILTRRYSNSSSHAQRSKVIYGGFKGTAGNPRKRKFHGFGVFVLDLIQRKTGTNFSTRSTIFNPIGRDILDKLREKNQDFLRLILESHMSENSHVWFGRELYTLNQ